MRKLSLVLIVKNEEDKIARCLESVKGIVDEIVVVDTGSIDRTKEIAKKFNAKVYDYKWSDDFSAARNYALNKSTGDWNLVLDADEYIELGSREIIDRFIEKSNCLGRIKIISSFNRNNEVSYKSDYVTRLIPKGVYFKGKIHEQIDCDLMREKIDINVGHDGYMMVDKSERNLRLLINELEEKPTQCYLSYQIGHTYFVKGKYESAKCYLERAYKLNNDFKIRLSIIVDYLYTLINSKQLEGGLEMINKEYERYNTSTDFNFVCGMYFIDLILSNAEKYIQYLPQIELCFKKCLDIGESGEFEGVIGTGSFAAAYNLGVWYEVINEMEKAKEYYLIATKQGYKLAEERLKRILKN